jgi:hypothetical protein
MGDAEAWRRWNAWRYVLHALEEIAPEALEDLARLVPVYREAAPHMDRPGWYIGIHDWESLGTALEVQTGVPGFEESLAKVRDFREALLAWGRKWNLAHPEPLSWAMKHFRLWAKAPVVAGKPLFFPSPMVDIPPFPPFRPPEFDPPIYGSKKLGSWSEVEKELRFARDRRLTVHDQGAGGSGSPFSLPVPADQGLNRFLPHPLLLPLAKVVVDGGPVGQVRNVRLRRDGAWLARGCRSSGRNVLPL